MSAPLNPNKYQLFNAQSTKNPVIVVKIAGLSTLLSNTTIYKTVRYGDPGLIYGESGLIYGDLTPVADFRDILTLDGSSLVLSQVLEPEQGRASVSLLSLAFIDKDQFMTKLCSPGFLIPDILGAQVEVFLGYTQISYPEDYIRVMVGRVTQTTCTAGKVTLQLSDPGLVRRQNVFLDAKTNLDGAINNSQTTINVISNALFSEKILGPDSTYDQFIKLYFKVDDEIIEYQQTGSEGSGFGSNQFINVVRGARGTVAASHSDQAECDQTFEVSGNAIDIALKLMLSGWDGYWKSGIQILNFVDTGDPALGAIPNAIVLPDGVDAIRDYGQSTGDFVNVTGATNVGNNGLWRVTGFLPVNGEPNRAVLMNTAFTAEDSTVAVYAIRSQWDVWPINCGVKLFPTDMDVQGHVDLRDQFLSTTENNLRFYITAQEVCKDFIEMQCFLVTACFACTQQGRLSVNLTHPPIAGERLVVLDKTNILNPQTLSAYRALNDRKFYDEIDWSYEQNDAGDFTKIITSIFSSALTNIDLSAQLPIQAQGGRDEFNFSTVISKRNTFLFGRYGNAAFIVQNIEVNWELATQIVVGQVVAIQDDGGLQISNFNTGERDLGYQLWEVLNYSLDIGSGKAKITVISGVGFQPNDRFASISPSSEISATGSSVNNVIIIPSFGAQFGLNEYLKWTQYIGLKIRIHSYDYTTFDETVTFIGFDDANPFSLLVDPPLSMSPSDGYIVDIAAYPNTTSPADQNIAKVDFGFSDQAIAVVSGTSPTVFDVGVTPATYIQEGDFILVRNVDWSEDSGEVIVSSVVGTTITVASSLGFTPDNTCTVEFARFLDRGGPYRML